MSELVLGPLLRHTSKTEGNAYPGTRRSEATLLR